jgi:hypothetical protein
MALIFPLSLAGHWIEKIKLNDFSRGIGPSLLLAVVVSSWLFLGRYPVTCVIPGRASCSIRPNSAVIVGWKFSAVPGIEPGVLLMVAGCSSDWDITLDVTVSTILKSSRCVIIVGFVEVSSLSDRCTTVLAVWL